MRQASIKETGEEIADAKWQRFEAAVGIGNDRKETDVQTDQPYREEAEQPGSSGSEPKPDDAGDPERERDANKTTTRTE